MDNRVPPYSLETEQSLLAGVMWSKDMADEIVDTLSPDVFYKTAHQEIFRAAERMIRNNEPVDVISLMETLKSAGKLDKVGGAAYLAHLLDAPVPPSVPYYCRMLQDKAALRKLLAACQSIMQGCYDQKEKGVSEFIDAAQRDILQISIQSAGYAVKLEDILWNRLDFYEELQKSQGKITGIPSMFKDLNYLLHGYQPTDLIILAARPSMGKSALAINDLFYIGLCGIPSALFSFEMSKEQVLDRGIAAFSNVNTVKFRDGRFTDDNWRQISDTCGKLVNKPIYIDDSADAGFGSIRQKARQLVRTGVKIIIIDYLQLMENREQRRDSRNLELSDITRGFKNLAKELKIPIVLLSQLSRKCEERNDKRPRLADLRDSGAIEQDADVVMFLYRDEVYNKDKNSPLKNIAELEVAKQRNGPTGLVNLLWKNSITRFENLARENDQQGYYTED